MNQQIMLLLLNPLSTSAPIRVHYKKLDLKKAINYSNEKCIMSVTRGP